jgi:hypothetical protein
MNKLNPLHYLPVLLKPVPGRVVLFNPVHQESWKKNREFLERLKLTHEPSPYLNNHYFDELSKAPQSEKDIPIITNLLSFALESISLPSKLSDTEYYEITRDNYLTVTEKFLSHHVCGHVAATRHVLLKDIQVKGVGRTASTQQLSYPNMNGFIRTSEAVRGYYNACLLQSSLPHGSVKLQAVICVINNKLHSSLVIRDAQSHRLAQIEPVFLNEDDRKQLYQEILHYYGHTDAKKILQVVLEQHLSLWLMGIEHPMTVDNLALAGFPMDEEDMRPGWDMQKLTLDFSLKLKVDCPELKSLENVLDQDFEVSGGINHRLRLLLNWYQEILSWILGVKVEPFAGEEKLQFIQNFLNRFYLAQDVTPLMEVFRWLEDRSSLTKEELMILLKKVESFSTEPKVMDLKMQSRYTILRLPLQLNLKDDLRSKYNREARVSTEKVVASFSRFEMDDHGYNSETSVQNSTQLHRVANRQSFCLVELEHLSSRDLESFLQKQCSGFDLHSVNLYTQEGLMTFSAQEMKTGLKNNQEFVLVDINIVYEGKPFTIPTRKKWVKAVV